MQNTLELAVFIGKFPVFFVFEPPHYGIHSGADRKAVRFDVHRNLRKLPFVGKLFPLREE